MRYAQKQDKRRLFIDVTTVLPLINRVIRLDGVDNNMIHRVHKDDPGELVDGIRVRTTFSEKRGAHILDTMYFRAV